MYSCTFIFLSVLSRALDVSIPKNNSTISCSFQSVTKESIASIKNADKFAKIDEATRKC